jgi:hypothetical protein
MSDTVEKWKQRVAGWRASGQTAEAFSAGRPWSARTLRWWSSRLGRASASATAPVIRVAQVMRPSRASEAERRGAIVVEALDARLRITIEEGASVEVAAVVLGLLVAARAR